MPFTSEQFQGTRWATLSGDLYVSNIGDDTSGDGSPRTPFKTISKAVLSAIGDSVIVVGPGFYTECVNCQAGGVKKLTFIGEGFPELLEPSTGGFGFIQTDNSTIVDGFAIRGNHTSFSGPVKEIRNCRINGSDLVTFSGKITDTVCRDLKFDAVGTVHIDSGTLWGVDNTGLGSNIMTLLNCEIGGASKISITPQSGIVFDYCNIEADTMIFFGTEPGYPAGSYQKHGSDEADQFGRIEPIGDYSVSLDSVLATAGSDNLAVGASHQAYQSNLIYDIRESENIDLVRENGILALKVVEGEEYGYFITRPIDLGKKQFLHAINFFADNQSELEDIHGEEVFARIYGLRTATNSYGRYQSMDRNQSTFLQMKTNCAPTVDKDRYGNGDVRFDPSTARNIYARYVQLKVGIQAGENFILQENGDLLLQENNSRIIWSS